MKVIDNETRWAKTGEVRTMSFVPKETLFYGEGCHLIFINLNSGEELVYTANNSKKGDGITCYAGHKSQNVFSFAEKRTNARIFVMNFPNFEEIRQFEDDGRGYTTMVFSESALLLAIGDLPDFSLTVWNWRLGEKLAKHTGNILTNDQILKCSLGSPVYVAQLGNYTHKISLWDVHLCGKKCILTEHRTKLPKKCDVFNGSMWTSEGGFFICDTRGCIYMMYPDHHFEKVIDYDEPGEYPTSFIWYRSGILMSGPNQELRHYKKSGNWEVDWTLTPPEPLHKLMAAFDFCLATTITFNILLINVNQNEFRYVKKNESLFNDICLVNPVGQYFLGLCNEHVINMYRVSTGEMMSNLDLEGKAIIMVGNPKFPYAAVGFDSGIIKLISAYNSDELVKMTQFFLTKHPNDCICFNECGTIFVVGNLEIGRFFIIEGLPGGQMSIIANVDTNYQIADLMMIVSQDCYRLFTIPVTSKKVIAGNVIHRYCIIKNKGVDVKEYTFEENNQLYRKIIATFGVTRDRIFYLVPYDTKTLSEIEIKKGDTSATVTRKIVTGHQMRDIYFQLDKRNALTWGYDGFVVARSSDFSKNVGIALPHHRIDGGVKRAFIEPQEKFIVSLGRDGVLVCTNLMEKLINPKITQELEEIHNCSDYKLMFSRRTLGYVPKGIYQGKCYLEVEEMKKIEKERRKCLEERNLILQEFRAIQKELKELLTANMEGPENEKLDLQEFNLNVKLFEEKSAQHRKLRKATEIYLKQLIVAQNQVSDYMMENYWNKMKIPGTAIKAIFANFEVDNYVLRPPDLNKEDILNWIRQQRKIERYLNEMKEFHPWNPIPEEHLLEMIKTRPHLPKKDEQMRVLSALELDFKEAEDDENEDPETKIAFSGSDISRFIEVQDAHYAQNELQTYFQTELQWIISKSDSYKLKEYFNSIFDKVMLQKIKEMSNIKNKNDRLRHIVSELNYFSEEKVTMRIEDPEWGQIETPELITEVKDDEVPVTPYISPSEQAILDAKAAEAERLRLLLLADDFRERALMAMMNGVLEVRWEDELRKEVPLPKCMIEKEPEQYNEDDIRAVKDYDEKVQFLNSERERYKTLLRAEYAKVARSVRDNIKKFNSKLQELMWLKLQVDSAISQESLKINRMKLFQHSRKYLFQKEQETLQKISENDEAIISFHKVMSSLHEAVVECRNYVDSFQVKDKFLDKAYKKDFQEMLIVMQEQASKIFRKRPKVNFRAINSASMLNELAKCILTNKPSLILNTDALDFLKQLENLDMYAGVSTVVDEHTYALICKHRRLRIEYEVKLKAAQLDLTEAETTSSIFHKKLQSKKEMAVKLQNDLSEIRQGLIRVMCDNDIQIVLPRGLVEIPLSGSLVDFEDAVLICRNDVENINGIILRFGDNKIKALQQGMNFRRRILAKEWEHKRMRMLIQDLQEKLVDIDGVRLTKEIQFYLKSKDKERAIPFETEVDMIKASYENTIQDRKDKVNRMQKQISSIKSHDKIVEKKIQELNVDVCELNLTKDQELDEKERIAIDTRMKALLKRSKMVQQVQDNHHEILMLQTELELLRLKTFPTLKYKIC